MATTKTKTTMKGTIKDIAAALQKKAGKEVDYNAARGYVQVQEALGLAKFVGNAERPAGTKGKPSKVYEVEI